MSDLHAHFIDRLTKLAKREMETERSPDESGVFGDDSCEMDIEDVYYRGTDDGETAMCREILAELGIDWRAEV